MIFMAANSSWWKDINRGGDIDGMFTFLSGGTGTPKLVRGFLECGLDGRIAVIVNTAEDLWYGGNHLSPDVDTLIYLCAGILDTDTWWGIRGDTTVTHQALSRFGDRYFLTVGDRDRATHIARADLLRAGKTLTAATRAVALAFGVETPILPMSDTEVRTLVRTPDAVMHFQDYWVKHRGNVPVIGVMREPKAGVDATKESLDGIRNSRTVIIGPSNPITSILPILECRGICDLLKTKKVIAISPFIGDSPVSGPAGDLMRAWGLSSNSLGVAQLYGDLVDVFVQDIRDTVTVPGAVRLDTMMVDAKKSRDLALAVMDLAGETV
jgi:LPPG:FO 2-phospho-L-lactate transferase